MENKKMENKKIIINYQKEWGNDGTTYTQTIKTTKEIVLKFNVYIDELQKKALSHFVKNNEDMQIIRYLNALLFDVNYINLTTLEYFKKFYLQYIYTPPKKDKNYERILHRNTIIKVI